MSLTVIIELATLVAYIVVILGGKQKRDKGWKIVTGLLAIAALTQLVSMSIVVSSRFVVTMEFSLLIVLPGLPIRQ